MSISLAGLNFYGTVGHIIEGAWEFDVKRTKFFGVIGESEILGGIGSRKITAPYWFYNSFSTGANLADALYDLDSYIGLNGTLTESGTISRSWEKVTFDGFTRDSSRGMIFSAQLGWLIIGTLNFTQLGPNGT